MELERVKQDDTQLNIIISVFVLNYWEFNETEMEVVGMNLTPMDLMGNKRTQTEADSSAHDTRPCIMSCIHVFSWLENTEVVISYFNTFVPDLQELTRPDSTALQHVPFSNFPMFKGRTEIGATRKLILYFYRSNSNSSVAPESRIMVLRGHWHFH